MDIWIYRLSECAALILFGVLYLRNTKKKREVSQSK